MLNSSESVNRVVRQYSVPSRKLRVDFDNELVSDADRIGPGSGAPSADAGIAKFYGSASFDADWSSHRIWRKAWAPVANRWARWRREREIKKAVATLAEFDDRTLRDIGIPHRSQIEHAARYGRNGLIQPALEWSGAALCDGPHARELPNLQNEPHMPEVGR
jgi:uncharacterized protein YjiS (DUF1127 family)